jgi:hypothetical protein
VLVLALLPSLMGARPLDEHTPMPTLAGIRGTLVSLSDWLTGKAAPKPDVPEQASGSAPGNQHPVPAAVTRAIARAQGYKPGKGAGQLPSYAFPAAKVKQYVTGSAGPGGPASFSPAASKPVTSGSTAASALYRNADGSYTRLEYPRQATGESGAVTFAALAATGVKGAHVTSVALRVRESWAGRCPSSATVSVADATGRQLGRWSGRPAASACGSGAAGVWVTVPLDGAGVKALSAEGGATLTVTATPAAAPATAATATVPAHAHASGTAGTAGTALAAAVLQVTAATAAAPQVNSQWPQDGYNAPSLTPELIATGQTFDGSRPQYQFTVYDSTGTWLTASHWQAADDWVVPAGTFAWAQTYYWTVQVFDSSGTGSPAPPAFALSTPVPQPLVSSALAQDGAAPGDAAGADTAGSTKPVDATGGDALRAHLRRHSGPN